jgi:MFS transporter, DHA2 family, methylenomycin A resistance protein
MRSALLVTLCAGMFLVQLDVTVVNVALPAIGADLRAGLAAQQWVVDGYSVVLAAFLLTGGALGDVFGHRRIVLAGLALFGVARRTLGANFVAAAMNFAGIGAILVLTLYLQGVRHTGPLEAGLAVLPLFGPLSLLAPVAGRLTGRFGPRPLMVAGPALGALGMLNLVLLNGNSGYAALLPTLLGLGAGMGLLTTAVVTAAVGGIPAERAGVASGINNTARQAGGAFGVAVLGAVAGEPGGRFLQGLHVVGVIAGVLWLVAIGVTLTGVRAPRDNPVARAG